MGAPSGSNLRPRGNGVCGEASGLLMRSNAAFKPCLTRTPSRRCAAGWRRRPSRCYALEGPPDYPRVVLTGHRGRLARGPRSAPRGLPPGPTALPVLPQLQPADLTAVDLVGPVGEAERPRMGPPVGEGKGLAHAAAA